jgi:hypothetical protein
MAWKQLGPCLALVVAACTAGDDAPPLEELQRTRSGAVDVVLLSSDGAVSKGADSFTIEFRAADGQLVDVGAVKANLTMPMAGMAPMAGDVTVRPSGAKGRYLVNSHLSMAGTWRIDVEWNGPAGSGTATMSTSAQ